MEPDKKKTGKPKKLKFKRVPKESAKPSVSAVPQEPLDDEEVLSLQLDDLRSELESHLPEPSDEFINFEGLSKSDEKATKGTTAAGKIAKVSKKAAKAATLTDNADNADGDNDDEEAIKLPNMPKYTVIGGAILLVLAIVAAVLYLTFGQVMVPELVGMSSSEATEVLNETGLRVSIVELEAPGVPPGRVIAQTPPAEEQVLRGTMVTLTVAAAGEHVTVPDVAGKPLEEAKEILSSARLLVEEVPTFDNSVQMGSIVGYLPTEGTQVMAGSTVSVLVSLGSADASVEVPSVTGLSQEVAQKVLADAGFNPVFFHASTSFGTLDEVVSQTPGGKDVVSPGATVLVLISLGNSTTDLEVPNVTGMAKAEAKSYISSEGFEGQFFGIVNSTITTGAVVSQMPPVARTLLRAGDPMGALVSMGGDRTAKVPDVLGQDLETAMATLREAGFTPRMVPRLSQLTEEEATRGKVQQQFPKGGSTYHISLPVLLYLIDTD